MNTITAKNPMYICAHCPDVKSATPGNCPKCGMKLIEHKELRKRSLRKTAHPKSPFKNVKVMLIILDGWGTSKNSKGNAITQANTPYYDNLLAVAPNTSIIASGKFVGQFEGEIGSSETGHLIIGAGRVIEQALPRITKEIISEKFYKNQVLIDAINHVKKNNSNLHLIGLIGCGGVHSCRRHAFALLKFCKRRNLKNFYLHLITDGRDTAPKEALRHARLFQNELEKKRVGEIVTVMGRYCAMDRDKRWPRTKKAYDALTRPRDKFTSILKLIRESYSEGITDEFITPSPTSSNGQVKDNDAVIFWNIRPDRPAQLTKAFTDINFTSFKREIRPRSLFFVTMVEYGLGVKTHVAYPTKGVEKCLPSVLSDYGKKQLHIAETEKFPHITYFIGGGCKLPHKNERWKLIPSSKVSTYDKLPEMSLPAIVSNLLNTVNDQKYDFIVANFANADMVGHSGMIEPTTAAVEHIDAALREVVEKAVKHGYTVCIVGDHGNAEHMIDSKDKPYTSHTTNKVPFILVSPYKSTLLKRPYLCLYDVAPTILYLMGLEIPKEMTGEVMASNCQSNNE